MVSPCQTSDDRIYRNGDFFLGLIMNKNILVVQLSPGFLGELTRECFPNVIGALTPLKLSYFIDYVAYSVVAFKYVSK